METKDSVDKVLKGMRQKWSELPPYDGWKAEASFFSEAYADQASKVRTRGEDLARTAGDLETKISKVIKLVETENIRQLYEDLLRIPPLIAREIHEEVLHPMKYHRGLRIRLQQLRASGKISEQQFTAGEGLLFGLEEVAFDFEDEVERLYKTARYFETLNNIAMARLKDIREIEGQKQLTTLNENLRLMTRWILVASLVIAAFSIFTFVVTLFHL